MTKSESARHIGHMMILASAGSGKTHALTTRFIRLLALGAPPERIVALTFTRKAAGEFFDRILKRLASAASDQKAANDLARAIGEPGLGMADFLRLLRVAIDSMHRLQLGTLDGFFARIVRTFPLELGLSGDFELLEEFGIQVERERVLRRLFAQSPTRTEAQRDFLEAFKLATFGMEEKRLGVLIDRFLREHQEKFLGAQSRELWGEPARIWRTGCEFLEGEGIKLPDAARELEESLRPLSLSDGQRRFWAEFFAEIGSWTAGSRMTKRVSYIFDRAAAGWPALAEIMVDRKKIALPEDARRALRRVVVAIVGAEYNRHLKMTAGIFDLLSRFEAAYEDSVRRSGKLTFLDVQRLLEPAAGARPMSRAPGDERLFLDYRLDAEIDHWLLDEFQDTSYGQWSVLRNLIDEAVQDPESGRSFFYVGDVKQAIFAWRGGDSHLFGEVFEHYNRAAPGTIGKEHLCESWRSGPPVIDFVNRVFGNRGAIAALFPPAAAERWNDGWMKHETKKPELGGHAALIHAADEEERMSVVARLLARIRPLDRGLTCAILVQTNEFAAALADFLRREAGVPATAESEINPCTDNPAGAALLALVKAAAHPGDSIARQHLEMSPVGDLLRRRGIATDDQLSLRVLSEIHLDGFERTMAAWALELEPHFPANDGFTRGRLRQFVAAAAQFDDTGSRDPAGFLEFMRAHRRRESDAGDGIRVMTIHAAKGLDFDLVILPDLEGNKLAERRGGLGVDRAPDRSVNWILDLPQKRFVELDPVLAAHCRGAEADNCHEQLSLLYVATTRAKRGLYVIIEPPGDSESNNFPRLLTETLGEAEASFGDPAWFEAIRIGEQPAEPPRGIQRLEAGAAARSVRLPARRPSDLQSDRSVDAGQLISRRRASAAERGTNFHALLAEIEWLAGPDVGTLAEAWLVRGVPRGLAQAARGFLESAAGREIFTPPPRLAKFEVWRERAFELVAANTWISGAMDRVVIERGEDGSPRAATIYDFKTDRVSPGEEGATAARYAEQMRAYRIALQRLIGLDPGKISCRVAFIATREVVGTPNL